MTGLRSASIWNLTFMRLNGISVDRHVLALAPHTSSNESSWEWLRQNTVGLAGSRVDLSCACCDRLSCSGIISESVQCMPSERSVRVKCQLTRMVNRYFRFSVLLRDTVGLIIVRFDSTVLSTFLALFFVFWVRGPCLPAKFLSGLFCLKPAFGFDITLQSIIVSCFHIWHKTFVQKVPEIRQSLFNLGSNWFNRPMFAFIWFLAFNGRANLIYHLISVEINTDKKLFQYS